MRYLFCHVAWMKDYKGGNKKDEPSGGGSYVEETEMGWEACNFAPYKNKMYGYVRSPSEEIKIERLGADKNDDCIENVHVIWTATNPDRGGVFIVGEYKNATVYRKYQKFRKAIPPCRKAKRINEYHIVAEESNCTLFPIEQRTVKVPKGGIEGAMGQANIWYADKPASKKILKKILRDLSKLHTNLSKLSKLPAVYPDDIDPQKSYVEGACKKVTVNAYERDPKARQKCLDAHGYECSVCEMSFEEYYGDLGKGFIHVHHIRELSRIRGEYELNPVKDLCPVCPNCHAMLHKKKPALTVAQLQKHLTNARKPRQ